MEEICRSANQHENANANETTTSAYANATIIVTVKHITSDKLYVYVKTYNF